MTIDQPHETRKGEEIDLKKLNLYLGDNSIIGTVASQQQFHGGYSNLTYLLTTDRGEFILRRAPFGAAIKSAHDMGREFKVLSLLRKHYSKVPKPIHFVEDSSVIGAPFYIMERIAGVILRPSMIKEMNFAPEEMRGLSESLIDNLVALHAIDIQKTGLDQLGKPEGYIFRQVEGWTKRYHAAVTDEIPHIDELVKWLAANQPPEVTACLIHNDYKYDNIVFRENHLPEIVGVLDWEMATVGEPLMDLGATLAYWAEAGDGELARVFNISWLPGNMTRKEVVSRYIEKSGRSIKSPVFYYVFGLFKNAVITQQIYARWKQGHSKDPRFGELTHVIRDLIRRGTEAVEKGQI